jgi:hypothetical protein
MDDHTCDTVKRFLQEAKARGERLRPIAEGAGVPYSWLVRFARGDFEDAASRRVENLYRFLNARHVIAKANGKANKRNGAPK